MKTKLIKLDSDYYEFPENINSIEEFVEVVNKSDNMFIKMVMYLEDNCVAPYFILEDKKSIYINFNKVTYIEEIDVEILPRAEYELRLRKKVLEKCCYCARFKGDYDNLTGHYDRLRLDGYCWGFEEKEEEN